ncbi:hypothetical protein PsYK624_033160 [Phanerochaete sordida]|uniref:Uncharacterized protein n=1 Tax=Phanerochaete sordida TaxID=48140 RepID=A0A9P3G2U0_9APHY|nr:hypothetical protein PsYK624_033160 [Phanerochaete sordida]
MSNAQAYFLGLSTVEAMDNFTTNLPRVVLEAFFFGLYTVVVFIGYSALARGAPRTKTAWAGLFACFAMYALAVAHIAVDLSRLATDVGRSRELMLVTELCMTAVLDNGYEATCFANTDDYDTVVQPALLPAAEGSEWVPIMFLALNILIGTGILLWRAVMRVSRKRLVGWITGITYMGLIAIIIIGVMINDDLEDGFGTASLTTAWVLTGTVCVISTADIWTRRHEIARGMRDMTRGGSFERVAYHIVDSCVVYAVFWTVIFAWVASIWGTPGGNGPASTVRFVHAGRAFTASAFVDIAGLYPTLLLVLGQLHAGPAARRASRASLNVHALARVRTSADSQATVGVPAVEIPKAAFAHDEEYYGDAKAAALV